MLRAALATGLVLLLLPAVQSQTTQAACPNAPTPELFAEVDQSIENLAFDGRGGLYLSKANPSQLVRLTTDGKERVMLDGGVHGLVWGPDNRLYFAIDSALTEGAYDIIRMMEPGPWVDASAFVGSMKVYSIDLPAFNGLAFDGVGNLFVSDDNIAPPETPPDLVRVPWTDPFNWEPWSPLYGPDGIVLDPGTGMLYTVVPADQSSPVIRFSPTDPADFEVVASLSYGAATLAPGVHAPQGDMDALVPKGLDDLTLGPDGLLYIAAHLSGELIRLDPATGDACILASGLEEPSSVRIAHGFGEHGGKLFVTTFGGTGVSALVLGQADVPATGKVWMFDVGFVEDRGTGDVEVPPTTTPDAIELTPPSDTGSSTGPAQESPLGPVALLALLVVALLIRR